MLRELAELVRYRELLMNLVVRDLKVRYKNSIMGFFWSLLNPLLQVATITVIFKYVLNLGISNYSAYLLCAFLPWTFFQMSVLDSSMSILTHGQLVKKTRFPREILPISIVISNLVHFILALGVFFIYALFWLKAPVLWTWVFLPVIVAIQFILNVGVALFVSCANVFYEDVKYIATVLLNLVFYLMPIAYLIETIQYSQKIPEAYRPIVVFLYYTNPLSCLLTAYRKILLQAYSTPGRPAVPLDWGYVALAAGTSLLICIAGYAFFNRKKWMFAEML